MKVLNFSRSLITWYSKNARDLPWRRTDDPYKIWISEIMLQQTTVAAVIPYYEKWLKIFPAVEDVAKAASQKILKTWQGLGYYSRARNIHTSSQILVKDFQSRIPQDPDVLRKLPGFGPYTVGAVLSIAYDRRVPIIDANVRRVIMRLNGWQGAADTKQDKKIYECLDEVMPRKNLRSFNQALMELGALICRSQSPFCTACPVNSFCEAYKKGIQEIIPTPKVSVVKDVHVAVGVLKKRDKVYIQRRPSKGLFADLWEFPGGKIESGETPQRALHREIKEETGVEIFNVEFLMKTTHHYTQFCAKLDVYTCESEGDPQTSGRQKWVSLKSLWQYPMPSGSAKIVERLTRSVISVSPKAAEKFRLRP